MIIRKAEAKDAQRAAEINVVGWHTAYKGLVPDDFLEKLQVTEKRIERFKETILNQKNICFVAELNGQVIGYLFGGKNKEAANIPVEYEVYGLYINPSFQRQGVGRLLLQHFKTKIKNAPFFLHALKGNVKAMTFYTKVGGHRAPEYDIDMTWGDVTRRVEACLFK